MANGVDPLHFSIRQKNPELQIVIGFFHDCPFDRALPLKAILRVDAFETFFPSRRSLSWIKAVNPVPLLGEVQRVPIRYAPDPAARVGQPLRFGKMTFTPAQGILDSFPFGYVHGCADDFNDLARGIHYRVRDGVKVLYLPAWNNDSIITLRVSPSRLCELRFLSLLKARPVVRVNSVENERPSGLQFRVDLINAKHLF